MSQQPPMPPPGQPPMPPPGQPPGPGVPVGYPPQSAYPPPGGYAPQPQQPYPPPKKGGAKTCLIVGLIVVVVLVLVGGGAVLFLGKKLGTFVSEKVEEPKQVASDFLDAAERNDIAKMRELSDPDSVSRDELEKLAAFVSDYCGTIQSKDVTYSGFDTTTSDTTFNVHMTVTCSDQDFKAEFKLKTSTGGKPLVVGGNWETI